MQKLSTRIAPNVDLKTSSTSRKLPQINKNYELNNSFVMHENLKIYNTSGNLHPNP